MQKLHAGAQAEAASLLEQLQQKQAQYTAEFKKRSEAEIDAQNGKNAKEVLGEQVARLEGQLKEEAARFAAASDELQAALSEEKVRHCSFSGWNHGWEFSMTMIAR